MRILGAAIILFSTGPLFETAQFWFRGCNDLGCSFTRTATVTVMPAVAAAPPTAFEGSSDLGEDWWFSDWIGSFNIAFASGGWLFHAHMVGYLSLSTAHPRVFSFSIWLRADGSGRMPSPIPASSTSGAIPGRSISKEHPVQGNSRIWCRGNSSTWIDSKIVDNSPTSLGRQA